MILFFLHLFFSYKVPITAPFYELLILYLKFSPFLCILRSRHFFALVVQKICLSKSLFSQTEFVRLSREVEWAGAVPPCLQTQWPELHMLLSVMPDPFLSKALHLMKHPLSLPSRAITPTTSLYNRQNISLPCYLQDISASPWRRDFLLLLEESIRTEIEWNMWRLPSTRLSLHPKGEQDLPPHCHTSQLCYQCGHCFNSHPILAVLSTTQGSLPSLAASHSLTASPSFPAYIKHQTKPNRKLYRNLS